MTLSPMMISMRRRTDKNHAKLLLDSNIKLVD
jgi:hypothetical protein